MSSRKLALLGSIAFLSFSSPLMAEEFRAPPPPNALKSPVAETDMQALARKVAATEPAGHDEKHASAQDQKSHANWGYSAADGAAHWADISPDYEACKVGAKQSPINIAAFKQNPDLQKLKVAYQPAPLVVVNNGHTVQVNFPPGSKFMSGETMYDLAQLHFHTPSEHYMDGAPYPMEMHLVHKSEKGELAVVGIMMKLGAENPTIQKIWQSIPASAGQENAPKDITISATDILPMQGMYYTYEGSLTTPPCSEGVKWHVLQNPIEISEAQLRAFQGLFPVNARPVQPLNGRVVQGN